MKYFFEERKNRTANTVYKNKNGNNKFPNSVNYYDCANRNGILHPTQKPVPLLEYLVKTYTNEGDTVLDNTMGSGTTGVACKQLNRFFYRNRNGR